jgi:putative phosphoesterase
MIVLGVLADTHIPDRARGLDPRIGEIFLESGVQAILHAGDVSTPSVLEELSKIAPVTAVRGNRDSYRNGNLPVKCLLEYEGVLIGLTHGHGRLIEYLMDKIQHTLSGMDEERYIRRVFGVFPSAHVIVFGHTHLRLNAWMEGKLLFNPGSACCAPGNPVKPGLGLLRVHQGTAIGEFVEF